MAEQDTQLNKYREKLLTAHSLEIEKINERHRNEMKKYHVSILILARLCKPHMLIASCRGANVLFLSEFLRTAAPV